MDKVQFQNKLHVLMVRLLRRTIGITWKDKIRNIEILNHAGLTKIAERNELQWLRHEMENNSLQNNCSILIFVKGK